MVEVTKMINKILEKGFIALGAYVCVFAFITLALFVVATVANACMKHGKFDTAEIRKLFTTNLTFMLLFALLDYFLV